MKTLHFFANTLLTPRFTPFNTLKGKIHMGNKKIQQAMNKEKEPITITNSTKAIRVEW